MTEPSALGVPTDVQAAIDTTHHALSDLLAGDTESTRQTYWHIEHATLFGAYGGHDIGWRAMSRRLDAIAPLVRDSTSADAGHVTVQALGGAASGDLAYTVELERHVRPGTDTSRADPPAVETLRVTQVYQRSEGTWRLIHHHADPLSAVQGPLAETGWSPATAT